MTQTHKHECPICEGVGEVYSYELHKVTRCPFCNGFKQVSDADMARYRLARDIEKAPISMALHKSKSDDIVF